MARSADDAGDGNEAGAPDDGDAVVARRYDGVAYLHVRAAGNMDAVSVGALLRGRDGQPGGAYAGTV